VQQHDGRTRTPIHIVEADTVHGHKLSYGRKSPFSAPNLHLGVDGECGKNCEESDTDANKPLPDRHVAGAIWPLQGRLTWAVDEAASASFRALRCAQDGSARNRPSGYLGSHVRREPARSPSPRLLGAGSRGVYAAYFPATSRSNRGSPRNGAQRRSVLSPAFDIRDGMDNRYSSRSTASACLPTVA